MSDNTNETIGEEVGNWLHQFEATARESLPTIKTAVEAGLTEVENKALIEFSAELIRLAQVHDPEAITKVLDILHPQF